MGDGGAPAIGPCDALPLVGCGFQKFWRLDVMLVYLMWLLVFLASSVLLFFLLLLLL